MGYLHLWEWGLWGLSNILVCIAYFTIPLKLNRARGEAGSTLSTRNSRLFSAFIFSCGVAHVLMFALMILMAWSMESFVGGFMCEVARAERLRPMNLFIWLVIAQSWYVAAVSWEAAIRLKLEV
tara:strand:- start:706 stop:1077 length:372 start_codon:yes stop_codon:yes gene_type:complete